MLGLGDFIFAISTVAYNKLQRSDAWRWAQQTRFGKNDALQITGRPNPTITIDGKIGNDSNLLIVFYVQIMPDDFVMQLHRF